MGQALFSTGGDIMGMVAAQALDGMIETDKLTLWVLTDNYFDALRPDSTITKRCRVAPGSSIHAEHGLAYFLESVVGEKTSTCMFDFGLDPVGVMNNIGILGLDVGKADAFSLSHGHFDHWMGAVEILKRNKEKISGSTPFFVGEEAFCRRYVIPPGTAEPVDIGKLNRKDIEDLGLRVVEVERPTEIIPGAYLTGKIDRVTPYEKGQPNLLVKRGDRAEPDDFRGEQALFFKIRGKGLVVLSGCAHSGIVNTIKQAQKASGVKEIHAVMGGVHLINENPDIIRRTVDEVKAMQPDFIVPTHCTGFEAMVRFRNEMPDQFTLNTAGTRYTFGA
jgi:7,8-dihydropterin-6-yl-methyl-4-(beta-D-ribofuranosyl)aminobenzene 5'-phosphate synthase